MDSRGGSKLGFPLRRGTRRLEAIGPSGLNYPACSFDAVLLIAVLTCIPEDHGQRSLVANLEALLRPRGLIYISDYLLQPDERNQQRYRQHHSEFGTYGVFRLPEGAIVRHNSVEWFEELTHAFECLDRVELEATTMNGHAVRALRYLGRKRGIHRVAQSTSTPTAAHAPAGTLPVAIENGSEQCEHCEEVQCVLISMGDLEQYSEY